VIYEVMEFRARTRRLRSRLVNWRLRRARPARQRGRSRDLAAPDGLDAFLCRRFP